MAIFRCKRSGNTIRVTDENDIKRMYELDSYEELKDESEETRQETEENREVLVSKRRGRPARVLN